MSSIFNNIFNLSPFATCIIQDKEIQFVNDLLLEKLGYSLDELKGLPFKRILSHLDYYRVLKNELRRLAGREVPGEYQLAAINSKNNPVRFKAFFSKIEFNGKPAILAQLLDRDRNYSDDSPNLREHNEKSNAKYREILDSLQEVIFEMDLHGRVKFANFRAYDFFKATPEDYRQGLSALEYVIPSDRERMQRNMEKIFSGGATGIAEYTIRKKDGQTFPAIIHTTLIVQDGKPVGFRGIIIDNTERKKMESQIQHLSERDVLTELYNRFYFENELQKIHQRKVSYGVITYDMDGLKLINDTMGLHYGDQLIIAVASALRATFGKNGIIARVGGDEFAVILTNIDESALMDLNLRVQRKFTDLCRNISRIPLTLSYGYAMNVNDLDNPERVFKEAGNNMAKEKLFHNQSNRSAVIQTLRKALEARDFITEGHAERLQSLVLELALSINLPENRKNDLRLLAQFHDIGKVGIPDSILFKKGQLSDEERKQMQRHSEIGYKIAQTAPDLAQISDWILKHHEWWDGSGYPLGLKKEAIPLECRILSIADAFDAMTNDRPYRKAMTPEEALFEILENSGSQFDPDLAAAFVAMIKTLIN